VSDFPRERRWVKPLAGSLAFHVLAMAGLYFYKTNDKPVKEEVTRPFRMKGVANLPSIPGEPGGGVRRPGKNLLFTKPGASAAPKDVPVAAVVASDATRPSEAVIPKKPDLDGSSLAERDFETILSKTDERQLKDKVRSSRQSTSGSSLEKILTQGGTLSLPGVVQSLGKAFSGGSPSSNLDIDPEEGMPGFTPVGTGGGGGGGTGGGSPGGDPDGIPGVGEGQAVTRYEALDDFLDIQLFKYADPADGKKYFLVKIFAKKNARLTVMPKEMIFAIDCSLSIMADRLDEFKKGIRECLQDLNQGDVFNVVAFQDTPIFFRPKSIPATEESIAEAEKFVAGLRSNMRTDVNGAIESIVKMPAARMPSNIILISDGRPTHGVVDDRELLSAVTKLNRGKRPIFAFSGGRRVNRYFLDFVAYQNRAWAEYIKRSTQIAQGLDEFNEKIKDPIFLNLRYELTGANEADTFPKSLPDFYRGAEFTVYGTYENEGDLSMQLLGDVGGQTKQLVFTRSLKEAEQGGDDILKGWAFNKVYHLISRLNVEKGNPALRAEMDRLSKRYGITTPYSPELARMD